MAEMSQAPVADYQLFRDVFDASPIGIAVETLDGQPLFVNHAFCSMLGFSEEELRGKHCVDFSPAEDAEKDWALFERLRAGEIDHYQLEKRYFRRDGSLVWGRLSISLLNGRESPLVLGMVEDITDKRNAEEALRASEEGLRLAAQIGKMYAYTWDVATDEVVRSPEFANVLGISGETRLTRTQLSEKVHPDDRAKWDTVVAQLTPKAPNHLITYRVLRPDGSEIWLEKNARAFFDDSGKMIRMIGMVADITERKRAEEALRQGEERLRMAQQIGRIGSFERGINSGRIVWTAELESLYGLPPHSFQATSAAFFESLIHPADRARVTELVNQALTSAQGSDGEWRVIWPDGSIHWIAGRWQVLRDKSGKPSRMLGINADATERKLAEEALAAMGRKLIEAQEQERTRIARELHDDINQRLALLSVELEGCRRNPPDSATEVGRLLTGIRERIDEISSDLQSLSHQLHSSQLEYLGIVATARSFCRDFAASQNIEIDFDHDDIQTAVSREVSLCLFRILQEGLHNAVKHSKVRHFEVRLSSSDNQLQLTISDHGVGFDAESALRAGGLGLISMRERVRLVNGTISIDSRPERGTKIQVRVPFASEHNLKKAV